MFVDEEYDVLKQITQFWLSNERDQDEKMKADARSILLKVEKQHTFLQILNQEGDAKAKKYYEENKPFDQFEDEMRTIDKIAQYWQEHTKEQDEETIATVNKIRMKIEMWRLDKGREHYERYKFLAMFEIDELEVLKKALTSFINAKSCTEEELSVAESIRERLEEP